MREADGFDASALQVQPVADGVAAVIHAQVAGVQTHIAAVAEAVGLDTAQSESSSSPPPLRIGATQPAVAMDSATQGAVDADPPLPEKEMGNGFVHGARVSAHKGWDANGASGAIDVAVGDAIVLQHALLGGYYGGYNCRTHQRGWFLASCVEESEGAAVVADEGGAHACLDLGQGVRDGDEEADYGVASEADDEDSQANVVEGGCCNDGEDDPGEAKARETAANALDRDLSEGDAAAKILQETIGERYVNALLSFYRPARPRGGLRDSDGTRDAQPALEFVPADEVLGNLSFLFTFRWNAMQQLGYASPVDQLSWEDNLVLYKRFQECFEATVSQRAKVDAQLQQHAKRQAIRKGRRSRFSTFLKQEYGDVHVFKVLLQFGFIDIKALHGALAEAVKVQVAPVSGRGGRSQATDAQRAQRRFAIKKRKEFNYGNGIRRKLDCGDLSESELTPTKRWYLQCYDSGAAGRDADVATRRYGFGQLRADIDPSWLSWDTNCQWVRSRHAAAANLLTTYQ